MPQTANAVVALTTVATDEAAEALVRALLERRLIACGTMLSGARSIYRWQGRVEDAREVVVLLKTVRAQVAALEAAFAALHPYEVPELLVLPVEYGLGAYLGWIAAETGTADPAG